MPSRGGRNEADSACRSPSPPLRQETIPDRRRTGNRRKSGTPRLIKQTTLTQLPDFFTELPLCSGRGSGVDEEESPRPTKRRRISRRERNQQTLTQLGHVQFILPSDEEESENTEEGSADDDENLYSSSERRNEEAAEEDYEDQVCRVKQEESEEGFVGSPEMPGVDEESTSELLHDQTGTVGHLSSETSHSPRPTQTTRETPQTPRRTRVPEVPSSQSPPESPLLTQPRSQRFRSPLRLRDANRRQTSPSPSKRPVKSVAFSKARSPEKQREHGQQKSPNPPDERNRCLHRIKSFIQDSNEGSESRTEDEEEQELQITSERSEAHPSAVHTDSQVEDTGFKDDHPANRSFELGDDIDDDSHVSHQGPEENRISHLESRSSPISRNADPTSIATRCQEHQGRVQEMPARTTSERKYLNEQPQEQSSANPVFCPPRKATQKQANWLPQSCHPSQATTTDSTQESPRTQRYPALALHSSQATTIDITQETPRTVQQPPSSPVPMPPNLASSLVHGSSDTRDFGARPWQFGDGRVITASQLLPDSIMDFSIPPPPAWTQESEEGD
ncbi:hypothetical protein K490DRAFT_61398 [Saccharata proteae CBS 121410]|uniref:Uncharacterized protein n=1 Tax=Saccharata proteae CBS 121410 TaxID=1314787 RepID=A0A9P4I524_9PEZI|nr:hypothetical protein K490DRAFT_61398 [Saccharata proteae CBS 121410]